MAEQTWDNCEWFSERNTCPNSKETLMKQFVFEASISEGPPPGKSWDDTKGPEINKKYCNICDSFRAKT